MTPCKISVHIQHLIISLVLVASCWCHEKTLRKIVRGYQSRMVHRPFSESSAGILSWSNMSRPYYGSLMQVPSHKSYQNRQRLSTIISSRDKALGIPSPDYAQTGIIPNAAHTKLLPPDSARMSSAFAPIYEPRNEGMEFSKTNGMSKNTDEIPHIAKNTHQIEEKIQSGLESSSLQEMNPRNTKVAKFFGGSFNPYTYSENQPTKTAIFTKEQSKIRYPKLMESYEDRNIQYPKKLPKKVDENQIQHQNRDNTAYETSNEYVPPIGPHKVGHHQNLKPDGSHLTSLIHRQSNGRIYGMQFESHKPNSHKSRNNTTYETSNEFVPPIGPHKVGHHQNLKPDGSHLTSLIHRQSNGRIYGIQFENHKPKSHKSQLKYQNKYPNTDNSKKSEFRQLPFVDAFRSINKHALHNVEKTDGIINTYRGLPIHVADSANNTYIHSSADTGNIPLIKFDPSDLSDERPDYMLEEVKELSELSYYNHNTSGTTYKCKELKGSITDIDFQEVFFNLPLKPTWCAKKTFWNSIYDSRYEALMRTPAWPPLKVILIPRSHVDSIAVKTFEQYHSSSVNRILSNLVKKMTFYRNLTFSWNEVSHLSHWWKKTSHKNRSNFRRLVKSGRLEITTGGWVEPDEATSHIFALVHQLVEGHQWLNANLNYSPQVAWLTGSVTHSPTMAYLMSASDIHYLTFTHVHYVWEQYLAEYQFSDFLWLQSWDEPTTTLQTPLNQALNKIGHERLPKNTVLTHFMQFNSDDVRACGPNHGLCSTDFNFTKSNNDNGINAYNIKDKAEALLEQYSKAGTLSPNNLIIAPIGGPFQYESQSEFDYQYDNYKKLADFINSNQDIYKASLLFGVARDYFSLLSEMQNSYPTAKGDLLNYADISSGRPAFWAGFFTTRPTLKILLRRLQSTLRTTEILFSFAVSYKAFESINSTQVVNLLLKARIVVARLCDRNVLGGTLSMNALKSVYNQILSTVKDCWNIQEVAASLMSSKSNLLGETSKVYLQKYVYREGEFMSVFRSVEPGDAIYIFNSLSQKRTEVVELVAMQPNLRIFDHNIKEVTIQVSPIWKYSSKNVLKISKKFFKIVFIVVLPPMTLQLFQIKKSLDMVGLDPILICSKCVFESPNEKPEFPFAVRPIEPGDIQLESYRQRLIFDETTGFLKMVRDKQTNKETKISLNFGAFRSSDENAGMFLFNTNRSRPIEELLEPYWSGKQTKIIFIVCGLVSSEITVIFGNFLQHTVRVFNLPDGPLSNAIYVESKVDFGAPPKNRELELFMSIQTDIENGLYPEIHTDNNGFQYTRRVLNITEGVESNVYPITSMVYIQDQRSRVTVITDHAQGVTALQEGQLTLILDRRILYNDGRGTDEGLADSSSTCHRHFILLEDKMETLTKTSNRKINLPSLSAIYLSNSMSYLIDMFLVNNNQTHLCSQAYLPLIKAPFPCDVFVLNFRTILKRGIEDHNVPNSALMIFHRQSFSCDINYEVSLNCEGDPEMAIDKLIRNIKSVYKTNLSGTSKGELVNKHEPAFLPSMELGTLRIYFV